MAVTKLWKVSVRLGQVLDYATDPEKTVNPEYSSEDYQALKDVLAYAKDEEKTEHEFFCDGINCNVDMARDQFITVKEQFDKPSGIQAYHGYLSFKENEVTPEQAQQIGMEFVRKMWGKRFQVVVTTHLNTKHLHCHFVINSVSFVDGKRLQDKEKSWRYFRHIADEICLEHKLSIVEKPELNRSPAYLTMKDKAGMPTRYNNAKKAIDEAIAMSRNLRQFQYELGVMGYHSNFSPNRKYATVTPKGSEKPIRTYRLGEEYTKEKSLNGLPPIETALFSNRFSQRPILSGSTACLQEKTKFKRSAGFTACISTTAIGLATFRSTIKNNRIRQGFIIYSKTT